MSITKINWNNVVRIIKYKCFEKKYNDELIKKGRCQDSDNYYYQVETNQIEYYGSRRGNIMGKRYRIPGGSKPRSFYVYQEDDIFSEVENKQFP